LTLEPLEYRCVPSTVTNTNDSGGGSLRDAIASTAAGGVVDFQSGLTGTITLTTAELAVAKNLTIKGPGAGAITISGNKALRVFDVGAATVNISGLTIANGLADFGSGILNGGALTIASCVVSGNSANFGGGGIDNASGASLTLTGSTVTTNAVLLGGSGGGGILNLGTSVTITGCVISTNSASFGGAGIANLAGTLTVTSTTITGNQLSGSLRGGGLWNANGAIATISGSTISNNSAGSGGGIANGPNAAVLSVTGSTIKGNTATFGGGGISNEGSSVTVARCTIAGNSATGGTDGGGFRTNGGTLVVLDSTIAGNSADFQGGGFQTLGGAAVTLTSCTISGNSAVATGGGVNNFGTSSFDVLSNIIAGNTAGSAPDFNGFPGSKGHNLIGISSGGTFAPTDLVGTTAHPLDPVLGPLANNGGPTQTMALLPGSPAINAGANEVLGPPSNLTTDQRGPGFPRLNGFQVDIGAFESPAVGGRFFVTGADAGAQPLVRGWDAQGNLLFSFMAFGAGFSGGVRVAMADVNGDGTADIIVGAGAGAGPHVKVFSGTDLSLLASFYAFDAGDVGGVFVAGGNLTGSHADVIVGADAGAGPHVKVFNAAAIGQVLVGGGVPPAAVLASFYAFAPGFRGGVRVAIGDINGDGTPDIIAGAGPGAAPHVLVIDGTKIAQVQSDGEIAAAALLRSFFAFGAGFTGGVYVAAGDVSGDGRPDVIVGAGFGADPRVVVFDGPSGATLQSFDAFGAGFNGGVRVAAANLGGGRSAVLTAAGPGAGPHVIAYDGLSLAALDSFFAYDAFSGGVFLGG
jgi:hypothetical protein